MATFTSMQPTTCSRVGLAGSPVRQVSRASSSTSRRALTVHASGNGGRVDKFNKKSVIVSPSILSADFAKLGEQVLNQINLVCTTLLPPTATASYVFGSFGIYACSFSTVRPASYLGLFQPVELWPLHADQGCGSSWSRLDSCRRHGWTFCAKHHDCKPCLVLYHVDSFQLILRLECYGPWPVCSFSQGPLIVAAIRPLTELPLDTHLVSDDWTPSKHPFMFADTSCRWALRSCAYLVLHHHSLSWRQRLRLCSFVCMLMLFAQWLCIMTHVNDLKLLAQVKPLLGAPLTALLNQAVYIHTETPAEYTMIYLGKLSHSKWQLESPDWLLYTWQ